MIEKIFLENFRNYTEREFSLAPLTVIVGNNGAGKTNILEAIYMLSLTTSWRVEKDSEVIRWGAPLARVTSGSKELVVQAHPYLKRMRIDGVSKRTYQVIGLFPTVLFQPDDMQFIYGAPSLRRHYIDRTISQTSPIYTKAIIELNQVLKQKNRLLKNIQEGVSGPEELLFWNQELARLQEVIQVKRVEFIDSINRTVPPVFSQMVPEGGKLALYYAESPHAHEHSFLDHLERNKAKEIAAGVSLYGPHREDLLVHWEGRLAEHCMSRGQARSLMIAFKVVELSFLQEKNEEKPVLLLDDIFSELDKERRERLVGLFGDYQVIMTTTELGPVGKVIQKSASVIDLDG